MPGGIGPLELVIVLVIVLVVFGPKRLPSLGRQLGAGMREFKDSVTGKTRDDDEDDDVQASITRATASAEPVVDEQQAAGEPQPRA
jgi:sec-independent protein translocase protein TatA